LLHIYERAVHFINSKKEREGDVMGGKKKKGKKKREMKKRKKNLESETRF